MDGGGGCGGGGQILGRPGEIAQRLGMAASGGGGVAIPLAAPALPPVAAGVAPRDASAGGWASLAAFSGRSRALADLLAAARLSRRLSLAWLLPRLTLLALLALALALLPWLLARLLARLAFFSGLLSLTRLALPALFTTQA